MSFASIVSSVIDVPATHSWGVLRTCPAWTEAISSSADANSRPFICWIQRSFGCASAPGTSETTTIASTTMAPESAVTVARGAAMSASAIPTSALVRASSATTTGEPRSGMSTNGRTRLPTIAPVVFTPSRAPELVPARSAPSGRRADAAGNARPRTTVTGSTTTITAPTSAAMVSSGRLGTKVFGLSSSQRSDANASAATVSCAPARNRSGSPIRDRTRLKMMAPRAIPIRKTPRIIVNT